MENKISDADLVEHLAAVLDRVRGGGERFVVERDGEPVAVLAPPELEPGMTWGELVALVARLPRLDEDFAADIEAARAILRPVEVPEWPD